MKELKLEVSGMKCEGCENRVKNMVSKVENVETVSANHNTNEVTVTLKTDFQEETKTKIIEAIEKTGDFKVNS